MWIQDHATSMSSAVCPKATAIVHLLTPMSRIPYPQYVGRKIVLSAAVSCWLLDRSLSGAIKECGSGTFVLIVDE